MIIFKPKMLAILREFISGKVNGRWPRRNASQHQRSHALHTADRVAEAAIQRARVSFLLAGVVMIYGTVGYIFIERMTFLDAFYQTVITIFGIGFSEIGHSFSPQGRVFTISLVMGGTGVALYALASGIELLISEQFSHWRQRRKMQYQIDGMKGHFIVCGYGRIGRQLAADFIDGGVKFVVIDEDTKRCEQLLEDNVPHIEGDATLDETLFEAGIDRARGLLSVLNSDASNVMTVVSARGLNPKLLIIARAAVPEAEKKLYRAGADDVISPYVVGARRMSLTLLRPAVASFLNAVLYDRELQAEINEISVDEASQWSGQTLAEAGLAHDDDIVPLAILRDGRLMFSPLATTVLQLGDVLIIVTPTASFKLARR